MTYQTVTPGAFAEIVNVCNLTSGSERLQIRGGERKEQKRKQRSWRKASKRGLEKADMGPVGATQVSLPQQWCTPQPLRRRRVTPYPLGTLRKNVRLSPNLGRIGATRSLAPPVKRSAVAWSLAVGSGLNALRVVLSSPVWERSVSHVRAVKAKHAGTRPWLLLAEDIGQERSERSKREPESKARKGGSREEKTKRSCAVCSESCVLLWQNHLPIHCLVQYPPSTLCSLWGLLSPSAIQSPTWLFSPTTSLMSVHPMQEQPLHAASFKIPVKLSASGLLGRIAIQLHAQLTHG